MDNLKKILFVLVIGLIFISNPGLAQETVNYSKIWERFSGYDANSKVKINHQPLTDYLQQTVFPVGRSYRIIGNEKPESYRASRIKTSQSLSPSRFEGSRIFIHAFAQEHKDFFLAYQEGLENLTNRRPLSGFNKNEQLAYWLNLYNVIVINKLIKEYPISSLKSLRSTKRGKKSFWDEKVATVEGVSLSLKDIEKILFTNFNSPEAAFGLWQGSIGGPRLLNYAFTGSNVRLALERNAVEFVNSNRGLRPPNGSRMNVSKFYEWTSPAFGTSEDHVLMFIKEYADPNFVVGVPSVTSLSFKLYDWTIADIYGGTKHTGQTTQLGGVLSGKSQNFGSDVAAGGGDGGGGGGKGGLMDLFNFVRDRQPPQVAGLPENVLGLLLGIAQNSRLPIPIITTEECAPDEDCTLENVGGDGE